MKDMLTIIYQELLKNNVIAEKVTSERIAYYIYPEGKDDSKTLIIITPLHPPRIGEVASNKQLSTVLTYQIDVQGPNRLEVRFVQNEIKNVMLYLGFAQLPEGLDEYLPDVKRFVDVRRYRINTKLHDINY